MTVDKIRVESDNLQLKIDVRTLEVTCVNVLVDLDQYKRELENSQMYKKGQNELIQSQKEQLEFCSIEVENL